METFYQNMLQIIHDHPLLKNCVIYATKYIPIITFVIYPCILICLFISRNNLLLPTLIKPLFSFLIVTILRKTFNRKRPYETMNIKPLLMHKLGQSFPSRHTVSAFAIALACLNVWLPLGIIMIALATIVSFSRILCGVHYVSDVISAIFIAFIIAFL